MAETVVDKLVIALGLNTKGIDKGVAEASNKLATGFKGIVGKVFAPLMAGMSFAGIFDSIYNELKQMNSLSKTTKASIEDITAWSRAVTISGGDVDGFSQTLMFLNQNLTRIAVTGHSRIKPFFEKLGLDATELAKKPVLDSLSAIGKAIEGMDKRESANMLRAMGFDAGTIKLLQSGEKGTRELIARQRELGVYTEKDAKAFAAMNKSFKEITSSIKTLFIPAVMLILNVSSRVAQYLTTGIQFIRKNIDALKIGVLLLAAAFSKQLIGAVVQFGKTLAISPFGKFLIGLTVLLLLLEDLWTYANNGKSAFEGIWEKLGTPQQVLEGFKNVGNGILKIVEFLGKLDGADVILLALFTSVLPTAISALITFIAGAVGAIPLIIAGMVIAALAFIYKFKDQIIEAVVVGFTVLGKMILSILTIVWKAISDAFTKYIIEPISVIPEAFKAVAAILIGIFGKGGVLNTAFDEAFSAIEEWFQDLKTDFEEGASAIGSALSSAANVAKSAWNNFITWLEQKWNWLKSLLPTFESIANKLPSLGNSVALSTKAGSGGNTNIKTINDNRNQQYNFHNKESASAGMKEANLVSYGDGGVAFP